MTIILPGYSVDALIYESENSLVYRGRRIGDEQPVILKLLKEDYPTPAELTRYKQEYAIARDLNIEGAVKAYELLKYQNSLAMVLEDFGGESLKRLIAEKKIAIADFLPIAIQITASLGAIHAANIVHKDINPSNLVFNRKTGQVKIIDFGISTVLSRENPTFGNPNVLEGTLAYLSPEQTGRMNRGVDYRSDFYSLGASFYELLTGQLLFDTTDAMELVYCHLAKQPLPPHQIAPEIPQAISEIVMKLLAKTAEERYQSAWGIQADLQECLAQLQASGKIEPFPLARQDISDKFQIPQKLYGRDAEIEILLKAFDRVASPKETRASQGETQMMLVAGYSGIGKSALVQEIYKPITEKRGYFISGKFDQFQRNIPYSAVVAAFQLLVRQLLAESEEQLLQWKEKLLAAFGTNGQIITDAIPSVELIVGKQPPVAELGAAEAQNRFNLVFLNFIRVFCQEEHPLVIFLDDLQWADSATLKLIELMVADEETRFLFLIGAYRDNEVSPTHPLMRMLDGLREREIAIAQISLAPLTLEHLTHLIVDTLHADWQSAKPLAELVARKTSGNPFFVSQFLKTLYQENLLVFDSQQRKWQWDIAEIEAMGITDNVVDLTIAKLKKLPDATQEVLRLAACVGNQFDLHALSIIRETAPAETFRDIVPAIQEGPIVPLSELSLGESSDPIESPLLILDYKFLHDRVQQAAYALIDEDAKRAVHLQIGRMLLHNLSPHELETKIFEVVDHLNLSLDSIADSAERDELARLNLEAGKKAKDATAYAASLQYLKAGIACLTGDYWRVKRSYPLGNRYDLALALHQQRAEVEYLNGNFAESEALINLILQQVDTPKEKAEIYNLLLAQYTMSARYLEAIEAGEKALELLGISLPKEDFKKALDLEVSQAKAHLGSREIASLIDAPEIAIEEKRLAIQLLVNIDPPAYFGKQELYPIIVSKVANLSLQYGNIAESAKGFVTFGIVLGSILGDYKSGYEFGKLAVRLSDKFRDFSQKCSACLVFAGHLNHWVKHIKWAEAIFNDSYQAGLEVGELRHSGYALEHQLRYLFYQGKNLEPLVENVAKFLPFSEKNKNQWATDGMLGFQLAIWNLSGRTSGKFEFHNDEINETEYLANCRAHNSFAWLCTFNIFKCQILYLYGQLEEAYQHSLEAEKYISFVLGHFQSSEYVFHSALVLAGLCSEAPPEKREFYWEKLEQHQKKMKIWAENCPENFSHKFLLIAAEMARILGQELEAIDLYDRAISAAKEQDFIQNEALGNELAAKFWLAKGKQDFAQIYMRKARQLYQLWGAKQKVEDLQERYPQLLEKTQAGSRLKESITLTINTTTGGSAGEALDLATVIKASQAIAGEILLDKLLSKLMQLAIENAGAQKGFLILSNNERLTIEATGEGESEIIGDRSLPVEEAKNLPISLIQYVARTHENVVLNDATREGIFTGDNYIIAHQPKSILCAAIVNQGKLTGILYLENNIAAGAFTSDRLEVVRILSAQAAISIENALLYRTLEQKVEERTAQLAEANREITLLNSRLKAENMRMAAELDITRQLQQMMLPKEEELRQIPGLDIAGFMEPADEVGGDYYDVLAGDGHVKIGIGDVTGHGLESGVLTIVVQAAVRSLLENGETESSKFLNALNRTVYKNVQRMNSDKNLSFALLDYSQGILRLSGQHEEIILARNSGAIERIDTADLGFPIGLEEDISEFLSRAEVPLHPGDVVLLYTDGIVEAENMGGVHYGVERLVEALRRHCHLSASEITQAIVADVREHIGTQKVYDDMTLVVLKQK